MASSKLSIIPGFDPIEERGSKPTIAMHSRHRSSGAHGSNHRSLGARRGFNRSGSGPKPRHQPPPPPPPSRKADILMEAGRLAAEYLVSKGLLPPYLLPPPPPPPPTAEGRTSALARLGAAAAPHSTSSRRRFADCDDYELRGSRKHSKAWRRPGPYDRNYYGSDWENRENGRERSCVDSREDEDDEDDIAPGFRRGRRGGFHDGGSRDDPPVIRSEVVVEMAPETDNYELVDDTASKVSSSGMRKDTQIEAEVDSRKEVSDVKDLSSELREEVKGGENGDVEMKTSAEGNSVVEGGDMESKRDGDLLKLLNFANVPTRPRSSVAQRTPKVNQGPNAEANNASEAGSGRVAMPVMDEVMVYGGLHADESRSLKCQSADNASVPSVQTIEQAVKPQCESNQSPAGFKTTPVTVEVREEDNISPHVGKMELEEGEEEEKELRETSPPKVLQVDEYAMHNLVVQQASQHGEKMSHGEGTVVVVDQGEPEDADLFPKLEAESKVKNENKRQLQRSFKIQDLNLMESPEITEIPDDPAFVHLPVSAPTLGRGKELSVDFTLPLADNVENAEKYSRLPGDDKVVPVIDLEDDCPVEGSACGSSQPKDTFMYSNMDYVLSRTEHATDLPGIQNGYSLLAPELLRNGISDCSSVQSDLNNLQTGYGLPGTEVFPSDDIYVSLGEIPIGFMEVWDQPHQEYGNFF